MSESFSFDAFSYPLRKEVKDLFDVQGRNIIISRGDTGALRIKANATRRDTGDAYTFGERDRALFSIKDNQGNLKRQKAYPLVNNAFIVVFTNQDTENLVPNGAYTWDVRYTINPYYDEDPPSGTWPDYSELTFPVAKGDQCMHSGTYYVAKQAIATSEEWTPSHWSYVDYRKPVDGDQVLTPNNPMNMNILTVVGEV